MTAREAFQTLYRAVNQDVIGQERVVKMMLLALLVNGHVLLESLPGLAKTRLVKCFARRLHGKMRRVQFTPDLLPSDLTGGEILHYEGGHGQIRFQPGPLFADLVLADEVNRAPPKVQSALLEAMEERQVTVGNETHPMSPFFMVVGTQNPIEQEGTYPLPEAQMDRFLMKIVLDYPSYEDECSMLALLRGDQQQPALEQDVLTEAYLSEAQREIDDVFVSPAMDQYIVSLVSATRPQRSGDHGFHRWIQAGISPRGSVALERLARANAWFEARSYITPDDVRSVAFEALRHRISLTYDAQFADVDEDFIIEQLLNDVLIPV